MSDEITFLERTEDEIREEILGIAREETGLQNLKSTGPLRGLLEIFIKVIFALYQSVLNTIYNNADLMNASGFWLSLWGLMLAVKKEGAKKTKGNLTITPYASGTIPEGHWFKADGTSLRFKVLEEIHFNAAPLSVSVEAEFAGSLYNLPAGTALISTKVIAGIEKIEAESNWITSAGEEEEENDEYRARIQKKWASLGEGNPPAKYELIASQVQGINETKVVRTPRGSGTIDLYVSSTTGEKPTALLDAVETAITDAGLICRDLMVKWPEDLKRDFSLAFSGPYTVEEIELQARDYILSISMGGTLEERLFYKNLEDAFPLLDRLEIIEPVRDVSASNTDQLVQRILPPVNGDESGYTFTVTKNG